MVYYAPMKTSLKNKVAISLLGLFLFAQPVSAYLETFTTGKDWAQRMTVKEKFLSLFAPTLLFHKYGVPLRRPIVEYIQTIDRVLLNNPYLEKEDVANIFASTVYAYEPQSRPAIDYLESQLKQRKNYEEGLAVSLLPHLLVRNASRD